MTTHFELRLDVSLGKFQGTLAGVPALAARAERVSGASEAAFASGFGCAFFAARGVPTGVVKAAPLRATWSEIESDV